MGGEGRGGLWLQVGGSYVTVISLLRPQSTHADQWKPPVALDPNLPGMRLQ